MRLIAPALLGKYRDLVIAIALFLLLDLGVLVFNFYTSRLIEADTARINLAGELRMYSQQLAKAVLTLRQELAEGLPTQTSVAQISESRAAFIQSLATLSAPDRGYRNGFLSNADDLEKEAQLVTALTRTWGPLERETAPLIEAGGLTPDNVEPAAIAAVNRNVKLMEQAGDLTDHLEGNAIHRATTMRQLQLVAIVLAFANFILIVFKFLGRLHQSDRQAEAARAETERILATVHEGLFLLAATGEVGHQHSASLAEHFGRDLRAGDDFFALLAAQVSPEQLSAARDYIELLFNPRLKPALLLELNPLREVAFGSASERRYLSFAFDPVRGEDGIEALLVTVFDITRKVVLEQELSATQQRAKGEVDALLAILDQDPVAVRAFLDSTREHLTTINRELETIRPATASYRQLVNRIARTLHGIKGEAAALGLGTVEQQCHRFEDILAPLRGRTDLAGEDLIPVAVAMNEQQEAIARVATVIDRVQRFAAPSRHPAAPSATPLQTLSAQLHNLTRRIADDLGKQARLEIVAPHPVELPESIAACLRTVLPQLLRNALAHGIEAPAERSAQGKPDEGLIQCAIEKGDDGSLHISLRDDGRGLCPATLREALIHRGWRSAEQVAAMTDQQVLATLFEPGFSSLAEPGLHAGRGDGLAVVRDSVTRSGGRLRIATQPRTYTQFTLFFGESALTCA